MNVLAIDPGYAKKGEGCACAYAGNDEAGICLWFERPEEFPKSSSVPLRPWAVVDVVLWEHPQMDKRSYGVPPETLIKLAAQGGMLAGLYAGRTGAALESLTPSASKGSVSKPIAHARLLECLTPRERADVERLLPRVGEIVAAAVRKGALARWCPGVNYYPSAWTGHNLLDALDLAVTRIGR